MIPSGEIENFIKSVGSLPADNIIPHTEAMLLLSSMFEQADAKDPAGKEKEYWCFREVGTEFLWGFHGLIMVLFYVQGSERARYAPYPRRLFDAFPNDATQADVEKALGAPDTTGDWGGPWIRYDNVNGNWLHFEFDDDGKLWTVGISTPFDD